MPAEEQVVVLYAGVRGYLDKVQTSDIDTFEKKYMEYFKSKHQTLLDTIKNEKQLTDTTDKAVADVLDEFLP